MKFVSGILCIDGRALQAVVLWMMERGLYMDVIACEPGINKLIASGFDTMLVRSIERKLDTSYNIHGSRDLYLAFHDDCAGNRSPRISQEEQSRHAEGELQKIIRRLNMEMRTHRLWTEPPWTKAHLLE